MTGKYKRTYLIHGIGIDDDTVPANVYPKDGSKPYMRDDQRIWRSMINRCYSSIYHQKNPAYIGCEVSNEWLVFSGFQSWFNQQPYAYKMQLDKDILSEGNRIYSSENCILLPEHINKFICDCGRSGGKFKIGVTYEKKRGNWRAECRDTTEKKSKFIGRYPSKDIAHEYWRSTKEKIAQRYAKDLEYSYPNLSTYKQAADALRLRYSYEHWYRDYNGELPIDTTSHT